MALMIRCILYPNSHLFVTTGGKQQAASITVAKIQQICRLIPGLNDEINWDRGVSTKSKDNVKYVFKNGSTIDILAARQSSRGQRRTGGLMEQCVLIDGDILNEVIIPTTNVDRRLSDGSRHKEENVNKSQIYITTAGWKNSFARPVRGMIGESKPCEPQNGGVILIRLLIVKAFYKVTLCQAV